MRGIALISAAICSISAFAADDAKLPKLLATEPPKPAATDTELQKLMKERYAVVWKELELSHKFMAAGSYNLSDVNTLVNSNSRLVSSFMDLEPTRAEKLQFLENCVEFAKVIEGTVEKRYKAGAVRPTDMNRITWFRLDAEVKLLKAKEAK